MKNKNFSNCIANHHLRSGISSKDLKKPKKSLCQGHYRMYMVFSPLACQASPPVSGGGGGVKPPNGSWARLCLQLIASEDGSNAENTFKKLRCVTANETLPLTFMGQPVRSLKTAVHRVSPPLTFHLWVLCCPSGHDCVNDVYKKYFQKPL